MTIWNMEITASESPQTVHIPIEGKYYAIKNSGEHGILVSSSVANPTEGADDVMKIPSGSAAIIPVKDGNLYVSAEEDGTYSISIQDDKVIPWSGGTGSGGGSSDNTHYKGTTTTPLENGSTTNPIIIDGESYTAVFGDVVVYGYTEFVFDGTAWSEFGRPFDTEPTRGSTNAVTSDGIYQRTPWKRGGGAGSAVLGNSTASGAYSAAVGNYARATGEYSSAFGFNVGAKGAYSHAVGKNNSYKNGDLFEVGNGLDATHLSNIFEVNSTSANVNGDIKINNVAIPTPYTTMPTITADMLGKIAMYVGATGNGYTQGCFYIASTDGAAEPTYSWVKIGGGGYSETVLWEYTGSKPTTMVLSQPVTDFDVIITYGADRENEYAFQPTVHLVSEIQKGLLFGAGIGTSDARQWYDYVNATTFEINRFMNKPYLPKKVVGIKY